MESNRAWIEEIAKSFKGVDRVVSIKSKPAVGDNENFGSAVHKILLVLKMSSGETAEKSAILKTQTDLNKAYENSDVEFIFEVETKVYNEILKEMEILLGRHCFKEELLWPRCYGVKAMTFLMEDLTATGYEMHPKEKPLDTEHALLAMKQYGKLHGLSMILIKKGMINKESLTTQYELMKNGVTVKLFQSGMMALADVIEKNWKEEWSDFCSEIRSDIPELGTKLKELALKTKNSLCVFSHGDCWTNNILFKYHSSSDGQRHPVSLKLVDFQEAHFNCLSWDLTTLLYISMLPDARDEIMTSLLETYRESLSQTCGSFISDYPIPTMDDIQAAMSVMRYFGFVVAITVRPLLTASTKSDFNMNFDKLFSEEDAISIHPMDFYTEEILNILKLEITNYLKHKEISSKM